MTLSEPQSILLVEDDVNDTTLFKRAASKAHLGNPIEVCSNGEDAIRYLGRRLEGGDHHGKPFPVVVLLDLKMPRKSGFDVLEWIKRDEVLRRMPVVVFTSSSQSPDIERAYELGANSYLVKPVTFEALVDMVGLLGLYWVIQNKPPAIVV